MTLVLGHAGHGVSDRTHATLTVIRLCTGVAVITGGGIGGSRVRALAGLRITGARHMTLIHGGAGYRVTPRTRPILAAITLCAGVAVITGSAVLHEAIGRTVITHTIAALGHITGPGRGAADRRALGISRTTGTRSRTALGLVTLARRSPAHRAARREGVGGTGGAAAITTLGCITHPG